MPRNLLVAILGLLGSLSGFAANAAAPAAERFSFVAMGCLPYETQHYIAYERLLAEINRHAPAFTVHCGDTKAGATPPTDAFLDQVRVWFDSLDGPLVYTPGDNEWTDVHTTQGGPHDPLVWLGKIRARYFSEERSLGRSPMPLVTQRRDPVFAKYVENARWSRGGVVFATLHVVGSNNNFQPNIPGAVEEFRERDAANIAWVKATFAEARSNRAVGVTLFFQAQPFAVAGGPAPDRSGFTAFLDAVETEAKAFAKPVLLVHSDAHRYRNESAMRFRPGAEPVPNVSRIETFGAGDIHAVLVMVDPGSPQVFLAGPLRVPGNPLPVLPRK